MDIALHIPSGLLWVGGIVGGLALVVLAIFGAAFLWIWY